MIARARQVWPPGIRTQLALLYTGVFAVLFVLIGGAYFAYVQNSLRQSFDSGLQARTQLVASGISFEGGAICIQDVAGVLPGLTTSAARCSHVDSAVPAGDAPDGTTGTRPSAGQNVSYGDLVRILDRAGNSVYSSQAFGALTVPQASVHVPVQRSRPWSGIVTARNGAEVQLYSAPLIDTSGHVYGVIQVGEPLAPLTETLQDIALTLLAIAPVALLLSAAGSYWLAGRAFRPILRLTHAARDIEAEDLHERVPVPAARDEVRDLALTLNGMIGRLERAFGQQRRFVADASHELRTPVAAIRSMTDVALTDTAASQDELIATIRGVNAEAERLGHLISDLLALARADAGQSSVENEPVRLDTLAAGAAAVAQPLATERGLTLDVLIQEEIVVQGDEVRLTQVAMNLIDNAVRYTATGGRIVVRVTAIEGQAHFSVADSGMGIAAEHLSHLFERFYRVDPARSRADGGSGLGLSIVESVVRAHGGAVTVESEVGRGSTFTVTFPVVATLAAPALGSLETPLRT